MENRNDRLTDRKKLILRAVVEAHIQDGEPVGSKTLLESGILSCSSATVRNEMAELEALGYLEQPHTSSGRIPTELGYRFYVDTLAKEYNETSADLDSIKNALDAKQTELDKILRQASRLASTLTNYTGLALKPRPELDAFKRYECVYINERSFLLVMIAEDGRTKTKTIRVPFDIIPEDTESINTALNTMIAGVSVTQINFPMMLQMEKMVRHGSRIITPIIKGIYECLADSDQGDITIEGFDNLLGYPEYSEKESLQGLLTLGRHKDKLLDLISENDDNDDVHIFIGSENVVDSMSNSSLIYKTVKVDGKVVGAVGVIGPRRMEYSKVIATVENLAKGVSEIIDGADAAEGRMLGDGKNNGGKK
ncbi:MAG: heat-inducible transcription repressor HrcA [Clostridia bacterium]|nr:heat-inducible transcription repressor HrcA [Clostridia bacterium]